MSAATDWQPGTPCLAVEHDDSTRQPKPGGRRFRAVVESLPGIYVIVRYDDPDLYGGKPDQFYADSGWRAWDGRFDWRLMPAPAEETSSEDGTAATAREGAGDGRGR